MARPANPKAKTKAAPKRNPGQPKRGPLPWDPTPDERRLIEHYVAIGMTQEQIAIVTEKSVESLTRHCRHELDAGKLKANAKVGAKLFDKCMKGDTTALIFWAKTQMGFRETSRHEHSGPDGGPIPYRELSDEEVEARIKALEAGDAGRPAAK